MATWSDIGLAAVGGGIGIVGTLLATRSQRKIAREDRREREQTARVARVAQVLGPIGSLIADLSPMVVSIAYRDDAALGKTIQDRWWPLREQLAIIKANESSHETRAKIESLETTVGEFFGSLYVMISKELRSQVAQESPSRNVFDEARAKQDAVTAALAAVLDEIHQASAS